MSFRTCCRKRYRCPRSLRSTLITRICISMISRSVQVESAFSLSTNCATVVNGRGDLSHSSRQRIAAASILAKMLVGHCRSFGVLGRSDLRNRRVMCGRIIFASMLRSDYEPVRQNDLVFVRSKDEHGRGISYDDVSNTLSLHGIQPEASVPHVALRSRSSDASRLSRNRRD